ncbi:hypothetical protein D3C77_461430 [compost metagenome]
MNGIYCVNGQSNRNFTFNAGAVSWMINTDKRGRSRGIVDLNYFLRRCYPVSGITLQAPGNKPDVTVILARIQLGIPCACLSAAQIVHVCIELFFSIYNEFQIKDVDIMT